MIICPSGVWRLASGNNGLSEPIIDFAYGWVCEQEKASQPHYHCWIGISHRQVRWFGTPDRGSAGVITETQTGFIADGAKLRYLL
ncbi:hypothetical protein EKN62_12030 [Enterobacter hormaechei]|nr:hypothetical protein EKN62_12030 [Enterobacter hormaechei]